MTTRESNQNPSSAEIKIETACPHCDVKGRVPHDYAGRQVRCKKCNNKFLVPAAEAFTQAESIWQELVLSASRSGRHDRAVEFAKKGIRQHPRSDWLWRQLGSELTAIDRRDEAETALNNARNLNPDSDCLWRFYAELHRKRKDLERETAALETLCALDEATAADLTQLGIAYHKYRNFGKALELYRLAVTTQADAATFFHMGRVFNDPEISQDADAADAYRRALALKPDEGPGSQGFSIWSRLDATKRKLAPLAKQARKAAAGLVKPEEFFQFYLNPFEVLQLVNPPPVNYTVDPLREVEPVEELDVKAIQRAKKRLLHEIDLNDGKISWLGDHSLDKSRALALEDELHDEETRRYHWAVFQNKRLLAFLTHGDIRHFLYSDRYFPHETLELLDDEPEFREFLSKPFARQYDLVLSRAIERRLLPVIEVLFDGRRWVTPGDDDICFDRASKRIQALVKHMKDMAYRSTATKLAAEQVDKFLAQQSVVEIFNLLPTYFRDEQNQLAAAIRSVAIDCFNAHSDSEASAAILNICKRFQFKSAALAKQLEVDEEAIQGIRAEQQRIRAEEQKHSFSALLKQDLEVSISPAGARLGSKAISPSNLESVRWGVLIKSVNGVETERSFSLVLEGRRSTMPIKWQTRGFIAAAKSIFRKPGEVVPIVEMNDAEQDVMFQKVVDAVLYNLVPTLVQKLVQRLHDGHSFDVGPCTLTSSGVAFRTGLVLRKDHLLPWTDCLTQMESGQMFVFCKADHNVQTSMPIKDTGNAVLLPILCAMMADASD